MQFLLMDAQLLILTYPPDLGWFEACLKSVRKYWKSDYPPLVIATPDCQMPTITQELGCRVICEPQLKDPHLGQVYIKMNADQYTDVPLILITDSDCLFTQECSTEDFMEENRPIVSMESYDTLIPKSIPPDANCFLNYRQIIGQLLRIIPPHEYMRQHPFLYYRDHIKEVRDRIESLNNRPLLDIMGDYHSGYFSEFNFFGAYCYHYHRHLYEWRELGEWSIPLIRQFHSWSSNPNEGVAGEEVSRILA